MLSSYGERAVLGGLWPITRASGRGATRRWPAARWGPRPGQHIIEVGPAAANAKQGGSLPHMTGYYVVR
jgi:hypothetical protein